MKNTLYFIVSCCMPVAVVLEGCSYPTHTEDHAAMKKIAPLEGQRWSANDAANEYSYVVSICASADPTNPIFKTAGVIQTELTEKRRSFSVGHTQYASIMGGDEWVQLEYRNGKQYGHKCSHQHRRAHIMIVCDAQVPQGLLKVIEENTNKTEDCYYLFELRHAAMCYQNPDSGLTAGSVICIVFITVVGLYLIGGFIYQRLVVGAKGWKQLPNYSFWQDFGNLQADGCDLVCRTRSKSASREYRGIGDDQLRDDDVGRDDSLLPM